MSTRGPAKRLGLRRFGARPGGRVPGCSARRAHGALGLRDLRVLGPGRRWRTLPQATTTKLPQPKGSRLQEGRLQGAALAPCPACGHRSVRAYGQLLVCAFCEGFFWRPES